MSDTGHLDLVRLLRLDQPLPESGPVQGSDARLQLGEPLDDRDRHFLAQRAASEVYAFVMRGLETLSPSVASNK